MYWMRCLKLIPCFSLGRTLFLLPLRGFGVVFAEDGLARGGGVCSFSSSSCCSSSSCLPELDGGDLTIGSTVSGTFHLIRSPSEFKKYLFCFVFFFGIYSKFPLAFFLYSNRVLTRRSSFFLMSVYISLLDEKKTLM